MNALFEAAVLNGIGAALLGLLLVAAMACSKNPFLVRGLCLVILLKLVTPPLLGVPVPGWVSDSFPRISAVSPDSIEPENVTDRPVVRGSPDPALSPTEGLPPDPLPMANRLADGDLRSEGVRGQETRAQPPGPNPVPSPPRGEGARRADEGAVQTTRDSRHVASAPAPITHRAGVSTSAILLALWSAGTLTALGIVLWQAFQLSRLIRASSPVSDGIAGTVARLAGELGLGCVPQTRIVKADFSPLVWCLARRPVVLLPARLIEELEPEAIKAVLAHELTHVARRDHRVRQLEVLVTVIYWWHPVVWWVRRELRRVEEECCDAQVLRLLPESATEYADALVRTVEFVQTGRRDSQSTRAASRLGAAALGSLSLTSPLGRASHLKRRVEMILDEQIRPRWTWSSRLAVLSLAAVLPFSVQAQSEPESNGPKSASAEEVAEKGDSTEVTLPTNENQAPTDPNLIQFAANDPADPNSKAESKKDSLDHRRDRPFGALGFPDFGRNWEVLRITTWRECQDELGLDNEQRKELAPLLTSLHKQRDSWSKAGKDPEIFKEEADDALKILTRKQRKRLNQIILQRRGISAFFAEDIVEALELTADQRQIIDDAWAVHIDKANREVYTGGQGREGKYEVWRLALTTLTGKQRKKFRKMTGTIVELSPDPRLKLTDPIVSGPQPASPAPGTVQQAVELDYKRDAPYGELGFQRDLPEQYQFLRLATHGAVQQELGLNAGQLKDMAGVQADFKAKYNITELRKNPKLLQNEYRQTREVLSAAQSKRVRQIIVQREGMRVLLKDDMQEILSITPQQATKLNRAWLDHIERSKTKYEGTTGRDSYHRCWKEALLVLTPKQRDLFAEQTGPIIHKGFTRTSAAVVPSRGSLPYRVRQVWNWLPEDIESVSVARDFTIELGKADGNVTGPSLTLPLASRHVALGPLMNLELIELIKLNPNGQVTTLDRPATLAPLFGQQVELAVSAGRKFKKDGETSSIQSESCSVVRFAKPLGDAAKEYLTSIRVFSEQWKLSGQDVLAVQRNKLSLASRRFLRDGQTFYVCQLEPKTLVVSTSDALITQVLRRWQIFTGARRATGSYPRVGVPTSLPLWRHVRPTTVAWGFRQVPAGTQESLNSITWSCDTDSDAFEVVALTTPDGADAVREDLLGLWDEQPVESWHVSGRLVSIKINLNAADSASPMWIQNLREMNDVR